MPVNTPRLRTPFGLLLFILLAPPSVAAKDCGTAPPVPATASDDLAFKRAWKGIAKPYWAKYAVRSGEKPAYVAGHLDLLDTPDGGWLRIRLKPGVDGEAWTHQCLLGIGQANLIDNTRT